MVRASLKYFLIFILTSAIFSMGLNGLLREFAPKAYTGLLGEKISAVQSHKDEIDVIFLGSSRTFRQINAPLIESRLKQKSCPALNVFNMGIPNLTYAELRFVLDKIFETDSKRLKMIIIGEPLPAVRPRMDRLKMDRIRQFSGWRGTLHRFQNIWSYQEPVKDKLGRSALSLIGFAYEQTNIGHLSRIIFPEIYWQEAMANSETKTMPKDWMPSRGYLSLEEKGHVNEAVLQTRERFLENMDAFKAVAAAQKITPPETPYKAEDALLKLYKDVFKELESRNLRYGIYLPPLPSRAGENMELAKALRRAAPEAVFFHYNDPQAYTQCWNAGLWFDDAHLNDEGSAMLSALIADRLCEEMKTGGAD